MILDTFPDHIGSRGRSFYYVLLLLLCFFSFRGYGEGATLFAPQSLAVEGKVLSIIPADLNGDGAADIVVVHKTGVYPTEVRWISIFWSTPSTGYSTAAHQRWEIDPAATTIDVGDVTPSPGKEIVYLTGQGISFYAQEKEGRFSPTPHTLLSLPTFTVFPETGSLPQGKLVADWKRNGHQLLLLPQFNSLRLFGQDGHQRWQQTEEITVSPRTFLFSEREDDGLFRDYSLQAAYRLPRIFVEDFNGDGRPDLLLPRQEYLSVYLQQPSGHFTTTPSATLVFPVRSPAERSRQNLLLLLTPIDVNGDGFVDVVLTKVTGKLLEQKSEISLFLHQQSPTDPFSPYPNQTITLEGFTPGVTIEDVNGDGKGDLLLSYVRVGLWDIIKNLLSNRVNLVTTIYLLRADNRYPEEPDFHQKTSYEIDLSDGVRLHGAWPTLGGDFTGDGHKDLLIARDREVMIYPKEGDGDLSSTPLTQSGLPTSSYMHIVDLNGDNRDDLIFYEKEESGKISILFNTGIGEASLPATKESLPINGR